MFEFVIQMPDWPRSYAVATVRVLEDRNTFLAEAILLGYSPEENPETRGMTFNLECSKTGAKHSILLLNAKELDIELVAHEVRHAYFWAMSNHHGAVKVNLLNEVEEEAFSDRLDKLTNRTKEAIEAGIRTPLVWRLHHGKSD